MPGAQSLSGGYRESARQGWALICGGGHGSASHSLMWLLAGPSLLSTGLLTGLLHGLALPKVSKPGEQERMRDRSHGLFMI